MNKDQNYYNTFIEVAEDCPAVSGEPPVSKKNEKTIPVLQFEMITNNPYKFTQEDILFNVFAQRNNIPQNKWKPEREKYFSKGQPCLRSSPLCKRYGWGIHSDQNGKVALYAIGSPDYKRLSSDPALKHIRAMRSKRQ